MLLLQHYGFYTCIFSPTITLLIGGMFCGPQIVYGNGTIVTAYFKICSKHSHDEYIAWMQNLLNKPDPMVIFTDYEMVPTITAMRHNALPRTLVKAVPLDAMWAARYTKQFWERQLSIDPERHLHCSFYLYWVWHQKFAFLNAVAHKNPFLTDRFAWVDIGYIRQKEKSNAPFLRTWPKNFKAAQILMLNATSLVQGENIIGAGFFAGTRNTIKTFVRSYYATVNAKAQSMRFIGKDQPLMYETCETEKNLCMLIDPERGYGDPWFFMAPLMAGVTTIA